MAGVRLPAGFEQVMDAQPGVLRRQFGVIAAPGAAGIGEHQHPLLIVHEGLRLGQVGRTGATFHDEPVDGNAAAALADDTTRAARDLRHRVGAEMLDDLVERAGTGGKLARLAIISSRRAAASRLSTGWPSR